MSPASLIQFLLLAHLFLIFFLSFSLSLVLKLYGLSATITINWREYLSHYWRFKLEKLFLSLLWVERYIFLNKSMSKPKPDDRKSSNQALMKNWKLLCARSFYFPMKNDVFEETNFIYNFLSSRKLNFPLKKLSVRNLPPTLARNLHIIKCS